MRKEDFDSLLTRYEGRGIIRDTTAAALRVAHNQEIQITTLREKNKQLSKGENLLIKGLDLVKDFILIFIGVFIGLCFISFKPWYLSAVIILAFVCIYLLIRMNR